MHVQVSVPQRLKRTLTEGKKQANKAIGLSVKVIGYSYCAVVLARLC